MYKIFLLSFFISRTLCAEPLNINFKNMSIHQLIEVTSLTMGKSILTPHPIQGKIHFSSNKSLHKEDLFSILVSTLQSNGYDVIKENNIYKVVQSEHQNMEMVELKNANAKEVLKIITPLKNSALKISLIEDLNSLLLVGKPQEIYTIKKMIEHLDIKRLQVYVKARIIEVNNSKLNHVGVQYGLFKSKRSNSEIFTFASSLNSINNNINLESIANLDLSVSSSSILALGASINLLKQNQAINIVSEPSILCLNNQSSSIYVGEKKSIRTASTITDGGTTKDSYEREDIGLTLKITPRISSDNKVLLKVQTLLENFSQTSVTNNQPDTSKKEIFTTAILHNGESVIIGGLIEDKEEKVNNDVPFLSQVPLLGNLFKDENKITTKKNLVVIITPYIVNQNSNLTNLREELAKLHLLEEQYLNKSLEYLKQKKKHLSTNTKKTHFKQITQQSLHEKRMKMLFGYE